jgi:hypothetical protein
MKAERKRREVTRQVADEGNIPGWPSTAALFVIALIVLLGLGLMHVASLYGPSHVPRQAQSTGQ